MSDSAHRQLHTNGALHGDHSFRPARPGSRPAAGLRRARGDVRPGEPLLPTRTSSSCATPATSTSPSPRDLGGLDISLAEVGREQRRLASYAPATALAVNMHFYWTGLRRPPAGWGMRLPWSGSCARPRGGGLRRRARGTGERPPGHALHRPCRARRRRLPLLGAQDVRLPRPRSGRASGFTPRGPLGAAQPKWSTRSCPGHPRVQDQRRPGTCWGCGPPAATTPSWTGPSSPTATSPREAPGGAGGRLLFILGIFAWAGVGFANVYLRAGPAGPRPGRG